MRDPEDGVVVVTPRTVQACEQEGGSGCYLLGRDPSTLRRLDDMKGELRLLPLADLGQEGEKLLSLGADCGGVRDRISAGQRLNQAKAAISLLLCGLPRPLDATGQLHRFPWALNAPWSWRGCRSRPCRR